MSVRLRFAPSPTGRLHVGNVRTALVNFLFARREGGEFLLRLDDTDPERSKEEFAVAIQDDLRWLGIEWDGLFRQSDRAALYEGAVAKLKESGRLYPCYETAQELDLRRKVQLSGGKPPIYDRSALNLSDSDRAALEAEGREPHWRFLLNHERVHWSDGVRGDAEFDCSSLSDPVLIRHDGSLLYTLPSVVDDLDYEITHVFRGEDHVANTAAQIQIFKALDGKVPEFAHFALLAGSAGEGLSKREGALSIAELREHGIEPTAITSLLARIGTSDPIEPVADLQPLVDSFDLNKFGRATAKFDHHELNVLNAKILHQMPYALVAERLEGAGPELWEAVRANIERVSDVRDWQRIVDGPIEPHVEDADFAAQAAELLPAGNWDEATWPSWTKAVSEASGRKGKALFLPLRQALTGLDRGPEMKQLLPLIGAEQARLRLTGETGA